MTSTLQQLLREKPIVVTGTGVVSAAGRSVPEMWEKVRDGRPSGAWADFTLNGNTFRRAVCAVPLLEQAIAHFPRARRTHRAVQLALAAADEACRRAGLGAGFDSQRVGVVVGTSRGPVENSALTGQRAPGRRLRPSLATNTTIGSFNGALSQFFNLRGPSFTVSATCASGAAAIALGAQQILLGLADIMLVGGTEAALQPAILAQLAAAGVLGRHEQPSQTCRPFDLTRNGLCVGEGAGFLVLESAESARTRGAHKLARLAGWATGVESAGRAGVSKDGAMLAQTIHGALAVAELSACEIDYVNVHGTGTLVNDAAEAAAMESVFPKGALAPACSSTKPVTGHCLGATAAMEAVICLEALQAQMIPPTANCETQDRECAINLVRSGARPAKIRHAMSTSLGFWGSHAALIFAADDEVEP